MGPLSNVRRTPESLDRALALGVLGLAATLGLGLRLWLAFGEHGLYWPDEIYQSLEPAHRLAFGYGLVPWEYIEGARSWVFPFLLSIPLKLVSGLGLDAPLSYLLALRLLLVGIAGATAWGAYRLARRLGAGLTGAVTAAVLFLLLAPALYFSHRALSETVSALPLVLGWAYAAVPGATRRERLWGAVLLGFAVFLRLHNGVFCVGLLAVLLSRRAYREALEAAAVLLGMALLFGLIDAWTWGRLFHSARVYLAFNVGQDGASLWGTSGPGYYLEHSLRTLGTAVGVWVLGLALVGATRAMGHFAVMLAFVLLHVWVPHKELRFLFPVLPLLCALAGVGLGTLTRNSLPAQRLGFVLTALLATMSAVSLRGLTMGAVGQYGPERAGVPALGDGADVNQLLLEAHRLPDLCGLKVEAVHLAWTGGYTYLHRQVPLYSHQGPPRSSGHFNYVLTQAAPHAQGVVARRGRLALLKLRDDCLPDPSFNPRLP